MTAVLTCEKYTDKCYVVRGDTKEYKDELKAIGGKWNGGLKDGKGGGWIFPSSYHDKILNLISKSKKSPKSKSSEKNTMDMKHYVTKKEYLTLATEVDRLRAIVENLAGSKISKTIPDRDSKDESDDEDSSGKRLISKK